MTNTVKKTSKGGRPKKIVKKLRVSFTLSPEMKDKVDYIARLNGNTSISSIVETLLQQAPMDFKVVPKRSYNRKVSPRDNDNT